MHATVMMRRSVISARTLRSSAWHEALTTTPPVPFICNSCSRAALHRPRRTAITSPRSFATSIPRQQHVPTAEAQPMPEGDAIVPRTHYDFFPNTFPKGPPPSSPFTPDLRRLRTEYLQLQAKTHPDLVSPSQKRPAEAMSMRINEAYNALQDPLKRAQYLLSLQGIDVEDESAKLAENQLLMEVMEAREAVEEIENEEDLGSLRAENQGRIAASVQILDAAFAQGNMEQATQEAIRLRYWMNIEESIQGWEKGKGGGILHH